MLYRPATPAAEPAATRGVLVVVALQIKRLSIVFLRGSFAFCDMLIEHSPN